MRMALRSPGNSLHLGKVLLFGWVLVPSDGNHILTITLVPFPGSEVTAKS